MILNLFGKDNEFSNIMGYDDIKDIVRRALDAEDNYNLLFIGRPASAKTLFLLGILGMRKDGVYFDGSNITNRILDVLEEERPKIICLDEIDKMSRQFQNQLLNFMESGSIKVDQMDLVPRLAVLSRGGHIVIVMADLVLELSAHLIPSLVALTL